MIAILNFLDGFISWQTPVSFMAGIGVHHIYTKFIRDREGPVFTKKADGTYRYSTRFWVVAAIAATLITLIGFSTQRTADRTDALSKETRSYADQTNQCLADVVKVLTTRVGYNEALDGLDKRRQAVWEQLVTDLAASDNSAGLNRAALERFMADNAIVKADQAALVKAREANQYPDCPQSLAGK